MSDTKYCDAHGCPHKAVLMAVDNYAPIRDRKQFAACAYHVQRWYSQATGSLWFFPLGEDESDALTPEQIRHALKEQK